MRRPRVVAHDTVLAAQLKKRSIDVIERITTSVQFGSLSAIEVKVPAPLVDHWEILDKEIAGQDELSRESDGSRRYRLSFDRPIVHKITWRVRYRVPIAPALDAHAARDLVIPWISAGAAVPRVELALAPEIVIKGTGTGWVRSSDESRGEQTWEGSIMEFVHEGTNRSARDFALQALALDVLPLPSLLVSRLLVKSTHGGDDTITSNAFLWVESHGSDVAFSLPDRARWLGVRIDGRALGSVEFDPSRQGYRLGFPADAGTKPVLLELDYQQDAPAETGALYAPQLLDGGVILQTLWEVRLPWNLALVGVPPGWADENEWYWDGRVWKRRAWKDVASVNNWLLGSSASPAAMGDLEASPADGSDRYVFSRSGQPAPLGAWIVPHAWLVAIFSGSALLIGFWVIFARVRVRVLWLGLAALAVLAGARAAECHLPDRAVGASGRRTGSAGARHGARDRTRTARRACPRRRRRSSAGRRESTRRSIARWVSAPTIPRRSGCASPRPSIMSPRRRQSRTKSRCAGRRSSGFE